MNVFYDPSKTDVDSLLGLIRKKGCSNASHTDDSVVLNPIIAPGDPVQVRLGSASSVSREESRLPSGWQLADTNSEVVTIATPRSTKSGNVSFSLKLENGEEIEGEVAVVRQIGRH